jgi:uncharacterized membrane-anchored protein
MTLVIFDSNTKNYTVLNKDDKDLKIELIKVQTDDNNNELSAPKQTMPKTYRKSKKLTKKNKEFLNSLTKDSNSNKTSKNKTELTKENQDFLDALKN